MCGVLPFMRRTTVLVCTLDQAFLFVVCSIIDGASVACAVTGRPAIALKMLETTIKINR